MRATFVGSEFDLESDTDECVQILHECSFLRLTKPRDSGISDTSHTMAANNTSIHKQIQLPRLVHFSHEVLEKNNVIGLTRNS